MIATHKYSPPKTGSITLSYSPPSIRYTSTSYIYAIAFSARLNGLQVDQVDRENDKRTSTYTQLVLSKLVAALTIQAVSRRDLSPLVLCPHGQILTGVTRRDVSPRTDTDGLDTKLISRSVPHIFVSPRTDTDDETCRDLSPRRGCPPDAEAAVFGCYNELFRR